MAVLPKVANTDQNQETLGDRSLLAEGDYLACVTKSEFKATKAGTGHYLNLTWVIQEGERKGSMLWSLLNLDNPNPVAVEMSEKELNSICQAMDRHAVEDSEELHGVPVIITVGVKAANDNYDASNCINAYKPATSAIGTPVAPVAQTQEVPNVPVAPVAPVAEPAPAATAVTPVAPVAPAVPAVEPASDLGAPADKPKLPWE